MPSFALMLSCAALATVARAAKLDSTIAIGQSTTLWSRELDEERRVFLSLPASYDATRLQYPVLVILDGDLHFEHAAGLVDFMSRAGLMPQTIVLGIANTHRMRDFTTPIKDSTELRRRGIYGEPRDAGGADAFLRFCANELLPWLEGRYRVAHFRVLVGHSFSGLLAVYALVRQPEIFQAHIAISPSLWWDDRVVVKLARSGIRSIPASQFLRLSWADEEPDIASSTQELISVLKEHPTESLDLQSHYYAGYEHQTSPHLALYDGLLALFADWRAARSTRFASQAQASERYSGLSGKYRYEVTVPESVYDDLGTRLCASGKRSEALAVYEGALRVWPGSVRTYVLLGECLKADGRMSESLEAYEQALRLQAQAERYPGPNGLKEKIAELRARVGDQSGETRGRRPQ